MVASPRNGDHGAKIRWRDALASSVVAPARNDTIAAKSDRVHVAARSGNRRRKSAWDVALS
jgi:hypothetical protein